MLLARNEDIMIPDQLKQQHPAFQECPTSWIEETDIEHVSFEKATWIPVLLERVELLRGIQGTAGHRKAYRSVESIIVPLEVRNQFDSANWQSVTKNVSDSAWADDEGFHPPGCYEGNPQIRYPTLQRSFATGEPSQWDLLQEFEVGLNLFRRDDIWIRPEENDIEVAKLERGPDGKPQAILIRAEHLRDYLCAKKAALLLTTFVVRDAVEEDFSKIAWDTDRMERHFSNGEWEGALYAIHEGGHPFGMEMAVFRMWRESVNPEDDVPEMPHPTAETAARSESFIKRRTERKLHHLSGRIWTKQWIEPASLSPRIRRDRVESRVHFQVENQEQKTLFGDALAEYRGWLWFKSSVIRQLLAGSKSYLKWYTEDTGSIGPSENLTLHFGINKLGLINVLGYKMADLPEWAQKMWVTHNVCPDGGLSEELHMSQNLAQPAETRAPEVILWRNLQVLQMRTQEIYAQSVLQHLPSEMEFYHRIHRFYDSSFEDLCELCKEIHRIVNEPIDLGLFNAKIDPGNAQTANAKKLRQIKRLALWLDTRGLDGRSITAPLAGVADLRQGDAHAPGADLRSSLALLNIPPDGENYQFMCCCVIGHVANCIARVADAL